MGGLFKEHIHETQPCSAQTWHQTHTSVKCTHSNTHHRVVLRSSSPAWQAQSCCGGSCWGCWSSHPSLLHCLPPEDMCFYPASSAQMRNDAPYCSARWQRKKETSSHTTGSESHSSYNLGLEEFVENFFIYLLKLEIDFWLVSWQVRDNVRSLMKLLWNLLEY